MLIKFLLEGESLMIKVDDNGIGRRKSYQKGGKGKHKSMGSSITSERLDLLSKMGMANQSSVHIEDLYNESGDCVGTRVVILLPLRYEF